MDRCHSSVISKGSSTTYRIPNSTQHDARQRCPALIILKRENNNNNNNNNNNPTVERIIINNV